jgi:hypothetical protein
MNMERAADIRADQRRLTSLLKAIVIVAALGAGCGSGGGGGGTGSGGTTGSGGSLAQNAGGAGGSNADASGAGGTSTTPDGPVDGGGDPNVLLGAVVVALKPASEANGQPVPAYTTVDGKIYDGASLEMLIWTVQEEANGCKLLTPKVPSCIPGCGSLACVADGKCQAYPTPLDLGVVHVKGVGATEFNLEYVQGSYSAPGSVSLPNPPAAEGSPVTVSAPGGSLGPLWVQAKVVAPLVVPAGNLHPVAGQPLALTWSAPGQTALGRMQVKIDLSHHGGIKGKIECDVADNGSLQVPASQITKLLGLGVSGYPTVLLNRVALGSALTRLGLVQLQVTSAIERDLQIDGITSCTKDEDCPAGKTCLTDLKCS